MIKFFIRFFIIILLVLFTTVLFFSYYGLETDKFDGIIKKKTNEINNNVKLEFNTTKIYLNLPELKIILKLKNPKFLLKNKEFNLSKFDLSLYLKSFYTSDFIIEKINIGFEKNDIKDLTKITGIFLPRIINKQLDKIFVKGNLEGEFIIPFNKNGTVEKKYKFNGKVLEADININKNIKLNDLSFDIGFGGIKSINELKITIKKGSFFNVKLLESFINIKFKDKNKIVKSSIHTKGNINSDEIKKILSLFKFTLDHFKKINLNADLVTNINFSISKNFKLDDLSYSSKGIINNLKFKILDNNKLKNFFPEFNSEISFIDTKVEYNKNLIKLEGKAKFTDEFEDIKILQTFNNKSKEYTISGSSTLNNSSINISKINYKKKKKINSDLNFKIKFILNKYFLIKDLKYAENKSLISISNLKLNNVFELISLKKVQIKTYLNKQKNNDFLVKKNKSITIIGEVFDAKSLLKSLYHNDEQNSLSKNFNGDIKINFDKVISGTNDDVSEFAMIAYVKNGSFNKLSLKGNFSDSEIIEMSIYQVNKDKKTLHVISDRARPFIANFKYIKGFENGKLEYQSNIYKEKSDSSLLIKDFKVSEAPALAKLLTLASLQGIADTLSGEGIRFDFFEMKLNSENNVLNIEDALAMGPAVSILLSGYVEKGKTVSLRGTLVPATKLNSIIASIPLVGDILVGKKTGDGVVGVSFKMKGPPNNIKTTVNPIKTLTPRFILRAIEKIKKQKKD